MTDMAIDTWLANHTGWTERYLKAFFRGGYERLSDLGEDHEADLTFRAITDDPAIREEMATSLKSARAGNPDSGPKPKPTPGPDSVKPDKGPKIPIAELPAGTALDLGSKIVIKDVTYTIPELPKLPEGTRVNAEDLSMEQWIAIAHSSRSLHGVRMDRLLADGLPTPSEDSSHTFDLGDSDVIADHAALAWVIPDSPSFFKSDKQGISKAALAYSSRESKAREHTMFSASISGSYEFCAASAAASYDMEGAHDEEVQQLFMYGLWWYPKAILDLSQCTTLSSRFMGAVVEALDADDDAEKFKHLKDVFIDFGHVVYEKVAIGGTRYFVTDRKVSATLDESKVRAAVKAAVEVKVNGASAKADSSFQDEKGNLVTAQQISEETTWITIGGVPEQDMPGWLASLGDPRHWTTIDHIDTDQKRSEPGSHTSHYTGQKGPTPLIEKLPPDLRDEVRRIWQAGLRDTWGVQRNSDVPLPHLTPLFHNQTVTIATCSKVDPGKRVFLGAHPGPSSAQGDYPDLGTSFPKRCGLSTGQDPARNRLLWKFVYAGAQDHVTGQPIYWIVTSDDKWALDVSVERRTGHHTLSLNDSPKSLPHQDLSASTAAWLIMPADRSRYYGSREVQNSWVIQNLKSRFMVAGSQTWSGGQKRTTLQNVAKKLRNGTLPLMRDGFPEHNDSVVNSCWEIKPYVKGA